MTISTIGQVEPLTTSKRTTGKRRQRTGSRNRGLPEYAPYRDTGCELASACLECPLVVCKYDDPHWGKKGAKALRDEEIVNMRASGMSVAVIAAKVNTSERTVYRVIQRDLYPYLAAYEAA